MSSKFEEFKNSLDSAVELIDSHELVNGTVSSDDFDAESLVDTSSLLDRCETVCSQYNEKPVIRVIHHLACSGGTLMSKCISAMPNVFLLSEVHPYSDLHLIGQKAKYMPSDISTLARYSGIVEQNLLAKNIFTSSIKITNEHVAQRGGLLVLREHSHFDFCTDIENSGSCAVKDALYSDFELLSIITLRDPIDSFASLSKNNWVHFLPKSFDEYCKRVLKFLRAYPDVPIVLYEDFVSNPEKEMSLICSKLEISHNELFVDIFECFSVTGNSGRSGDVISRRKRLPISTEYEHDIVVSLNYEKLIAYLEDRLNLPEKRNNYTLIEKNKG